MFEPTLKLGYKVKKDHSDRTKNISTNNGNKTIAINNATTINIVVPQQQTAEEINGPLGQAIGQLQQLNLSNINTPVPIAPAAVNELVPSTSSDADAQHHTRDGTVALMDKAKGQLPNLLQSFDSDWSDLGSSNDDSDSDTCTGFSPSNSRNLNAIISWQQCSVTEHYPYNMVRVGEDIDGGGIYAGRAFHGDDLLPAKVIPSRNVAYVCWDGKEFEKKEFEVLLEGHFEWKSASNGKVPSRGIEFGTTDCGETLYMGRTKHKGSLTPGKVHPSHGCLYIPFDGKEISYKKYEVLCFKSSKETSSFLETTKVVFPFLADIL